MYALGEDQMIYLRMKYDVDVCMRRIRCGGDKTANSPAKRIMRWMINFYFFARSLLLLRPQQIHCFSWKICWSIFYARISINLFPHFIDMLNFILCLACAFFSGCLYPPSIFRMAENVVRSCSSPKYNIKHFERKKTIFALLPMTDITTYNVFNCLRFFISFHFITFSSVFILLAKKNSFSLWLPDELKSTCTHVIQQHVRVPNKIEMRMRTFCGENTCGLSGFGWRSFNPFNYPINAIFSVGNEISSWNWNSLLLLFLNQIFRSHSTVATGTMCAEQLYEEIAWWDNFVLGLVLIDDTVSFFTLKTLATNKVKM